MSAKAAVSFSIALLLAASGSALAQDCNQNGVPDAVDIAERTSQDCNSNRTPDECDTRVSFIPHQVSASAHLAGNLCSVNSEQECVASRQYVSWAEGATCEDVLLACNPCNCCEEQGASGCNCQGCEDLVCGTDLLCCAIGWDTVCADLASTLCSCCEGQDPGVCD
jgi:hypothetical protein